MIKIRLRRRRGLKPLYALIDDVDRHLVALPWRAQPARTGVFYASYRPKQLRGRPRGMKYLHREVLRAAKGVEVDHENGNPLDCRRHNLRIATPVENRRNMRRPRHNTSGFKGVARSVNDRWRAYICGRHLGLFDTPEEAAHAYDRAASAQFGDFARLNFPRS